MTRFQAIFCRKPPIGLSELGIPIELVSGISTEEDLDRTIQECNIQSELPETSPTENQQSSDYPSPPQQIDLYADPYLEEISQPFPNTLHVYEESHDYYFRSESLPPTPLNSKFPTIELEDSNTPEQREFQSETSINCAVCERETTKAHTCPGCCRYIHSICGRTEGDEGYGSSVWCLRCDLQQRQTNSETQRKGIKRKQIDLHQRMVKANCNHFPDANIGDNILLPITKPDSIAFGKKNMLGVVLSKENDLYSIGTKYGVLDTNYTKNQFDICPSKFLEQEGVPQNRISQRTAMQNASQGVTYLCKCKSCSTSRCPCRKASLVCHSRCHQGKSCLNKSNF